MLTPITDSPVVHYGLTWRGQYNDTQAADCWEASHDHFKYLIVDYGFKVVLLITNTRTSKEIGHRLAGMKAAAFMASQHAQVEHF